jgi:hypothetical protein
MNTKIIELGKQFKEFKKRDSELKAEMKILDEKWSACEEQLLEAMVEEGVKSVTIENVGMLSMRTTNFLSVTADNKPSFFEYLQESGNSGLLKLDVHAATLKSFLDGHLEKLVQEKKDAGIDEMEARSEALEFLKSKGAGYFTKRGVALKG